MAMTLVAETREEVRREAQIPDVSADPVRHSRPPACGLRRWLAGVAVGTCPPGLNASLGNRATAQALRGPAAPRASSPATPEMLGRLHVLGDLIGDLPPGTTGQSRRTLSPAHLLEAHTILGDITTWMSALVTSENLHRRFGGHPLGREHASALAFQALGAVRQLQSYLRLYGSRSLPRALVEAELGRVAASRDILRVLSDELEVGASPVAGVDRYATMTLAGAGGLLLAGASPVVLAAAEESIFLGIQAASRLAPAAANLALTNPQIATAIAVEVTAATAHIATADHPREATKQLFTPMGLLLPILNVMGAAPSAGPRRPTPEASTRMPPQTSARALSGAQVASQDIRARLVAAAQYIMSKHGRAPIFSRPRGSNTFERADRQDARPTALRRDRSMTAYLEPDTPTKGTPILDDLQATGTPISRQAGGTTIGLVRDRHLPPASIAGLAPTKSVIIIGHGSKGQTTIVSKVGTNMDDYDGHIYSTEGLAKLVKEALPDGGSVHLFACRSEAAGRALQLALGPKWVVGGSRDVVFVPDYIYNEHGRTVPTEGFHSANPHWSPPKPGTPVLNPFAANR
jgi:hypothetical protein